MKSRNIKPGFFINDKMGMLPPSTRLLFIGLWCAADREGRLQDRPRRIMAEVFPYDSFDADAMLASLANEGFVTRYNVGGERFIQITNFLRHQRPHPNEAKSAIPPQEHTEDMLWSTIGQPLVNQRRTRDTPRLDLGHTKVTPLQVDIVNDDVMKDSKEVAHAPPHPAVDAGKNPDTMKQPSGTPNEPKAIIFKTGLGILMAAGKTNGQARGLLGKLVKDFGDRDVAELVVCPGFASAMEPAAYLTAALKKRREEVGTGPTPEYLARVAELRASGETQYIKFVLPTGEIDFGAASDALVRG